MKAQKAPRSAEARLAPTQSSLPWRALGWGAAIALLLTPWVAMQFTPEVNWTLGDFLVFGVMLGVAGGLLELTVRATRRPALRRGVAAVVLVGFVLIWIQGAVGLIGP
jgi:hypothetical protein